MKRDRVRRALAARNAAQPDGLTKVPAHEWPRTIPNGLIEVWRSKTLLVQIYSSENSEAMLRLSVCRTSLATGGNRWADGLSWDDLQAAKSAVGLGRFCAVEIYPPDGCTVNVANMRHLWLLSVAPAFMWRS